MNKQMFLVFMFTLPAFQLPVHAEEQPGMVPDKQLAKYVIEHLDLTSFPSSIGYRCQPNKTTFADYGFVTEHVNEGRATLEAKTKDWLFEILVVNHDKTSVTICLHDKAENFGNYNTESILQLHPSKRGDKLIAAGSSWIAAGY